MKKRPLVLILLLLLLLSLTPMDVTAVYGDESSESITSFSESLADDVLSYPDSMGNFLAVDGNATDVTGGTYASTQASDDVNWYVEATITGSTYNSTFLLEFNTSMIQQPPLIEVNIEYFFNRSDGSGTFDDGGVQLYNYSSSSWNYIYTDTDWHGSEVSRTIFANSSGCADPGGALYLRVTLELTDGGDGTDFGLYIDFCQISFITLADSEHYAESFADVSDWINHNGISLTTDGDVATWIIAGDGGSKNFYTNDISLTVGAGDYFEFYIKTNHTVANQVNGWIYTYTGDDKTGDLIPIQPDRTYLAANSWESKKYHVNTAGTIESMMFYLRAQTGGAAVEIYVDLFRMGDSTEFGWQHDGSTTQGTGSHVAGKVTASSSDGVLEVTNTDSTAAQALAFWIDNTSTPAALETDYYPFLKINVTDIQVGGEWRLSLYNGSMETIIQSTTSSTGIFYYNIKAGYASDPDRILFYVGGVISHNKWAAVSLVKAYSIANFTVTTSGGDVNDVVYVNGNSLIYAESSATYLRVRHDPAINVTTATYNVWNATLSSGASGFKFREEADNANSFDTGVTRGALTSTTLTDFEFYFYSSLEISAIKFIDYREWQEINDVELMFQVNWSPEFQFGYDAFFIFLGLIMIPVSTMYLARGGRKGMSMDKLFFGLVIFALGIGFLIGGILP